MPQIEAFRGLRYDLGHVGNLSDVIAPPYDVIGPELQTELYKRHPSNIVRVILNREEPGDDEANNRYARAAGFLKDWRDQGVLFSESDPAVYVYHQQFTWQGQTYNRRGFMARVRLERFGEGKIYPHEETHSAAKADRLKLTRACRANLSQIFGLYPDAENVAQNRLEQVVAGETPLQATDHLGVVHRMWPVMDAEVICEVQGLVGGSPVFIADGHHRYETALNYREELAAGGTLPPEHPANFVLMMLISMSDPGLIVLPTHRLFRGLPEMSSSQLTEKLGDFFDTRLAGEGSDLAQSVWEEIETEGEQGTLGLFTTEDERWVLARINEAGRKRMDQVASEHSTGWRSLGVSILQRLVIENLLGFEKLPEAKYVHQVSEAVEGLDTGEFPVAALVMPATLDHIQDISSHLERMPAKSTYFYPKLLSGLVINPIE